MVLKIMQGLYVKVKLYIFLYIFVELTNVHFSFIPNINDVIRHITYTQLHHIVSFAEITYKYRLRIEVKGDPSDPAVRDIIHRKVSVTPPAQHPISSNSLSLCWCLLPFNLTVYPLESDTGEATQPWEFHPQLENSI